MRGCRSHGCLAPECHGRNDLGGEQTQGPEDKRMAVAPKSVPCGRRCTVIAHCRPGRNTGKADVTWEETSTCTMWSAGVRVQAPGERLVEITSGRATSQQGLATTCKDPSTEAATVGDGRDLVWRMSP